MQLDSSRRHWDTIVIGGGQAGLAAGHHLSRLGCDFVILDAEARVGDAWRRRWDSLRLFTPAQHDGLPGMPFPAPRGTFPTKDEVADYLERYARRFALPLRSGARVERLARSDGRFEISSSSGQFTAERVVVATGTNPAPRVPAFAAELDPRIHQIHASQYANPASLPPGNVLVVGAGTSGVEIAIECAAHRPTAIAGRPTFHVPDPLLRYAGGFYWLFVHHVLTQGTPLGRKARPQILKGGAPLIRVSTADLHAAKVERLPRVAGVEAGLPRLEDGRAWKVASVVWATGYRPDFGWIDLPATDETGWLAGRRGVSTVVPGLYFVGQLFQYGLTSGLIGGVGRDAAFVAEHIRAHAARESVGRLARAIPER